MNIKELKNVKKIEAFDGNYAIYQSNDEKEGIINRDGEVLLEAKKYDFVFKEMYNNIYTLAIDSTPITDYFNADTREIIHLTDEDIKAGKQKNVITKKELLSKMCFIPWEGPFYYKGFHGKKFLIVGESYYEDPEWTNDVNNFPYATIHAIQKYVYGWAQPTFDAFTSVMLGKRNEESMAKEKAEFWNSVVYYNFIQDGLRSKAQDNSIIPNKWLRHGKELLLNMLSLYQPDVTLIFSKQIWRHYADYKGAEFSQNFREIALQHSSIAIFNLNGYHLVGIHHPSCLLSLESKQEIYEFLKDKRYI